MSKFMPYPIPGTPELIIRLVVECIEEIRKARRDRRHDEDYN